MKRFLYVWLLFVAVSARADQLQLMGGTVIDPASGAITKNAGILITHDRIMQVGGARSIYAAKGTRWIDCRGKFILPGYIDTHVHFFQSADLFTRPDGADLNNVRPYKDEVAWIKSHLNDTFARYIRCGCRRTNVEFRGPQNCERNRESAARRSRRSTHFQRVA